MNSRHVEEVKVDKLMTGGQFGKAKHEQLIRRTFPVPCVKSPAHVRPHKPVVPLPQ